MSECECLSKCPFFNDKMANMDAMAEDTKNRYCRSDYEHCARYMVFKLLGRENVPTDLYPLQKSKARQILEQAGKA